MTNGFNLSEPATRYIDAANRSISVGGTDFAYRELGPRGGVPLILLNLWVTVWPGPICASARMSGT